jgi:hypothetical protein
MEAKNITVKDRNFHFEMIEGHDKAILEITVSQRDGDDFRRSKLEIPKECLQDFGATFFECLVEINGDGGQEDQPSMDVDTDKEKAYSVNQIRKKHKQAYAKWTAEDDERLKKLHEEGRKVSDLAEDFGRKDGAIRSRLKKIGVIN